MEDAMRVAAKAKSTLKPSAGAKSSPESHRDEPLSSRWDAYSGIAELGELLERRQARPVELAAACLRRIDELQPRLNAFITIAAQETRRDAEAAERSLERQEWKGFLHGIPVGVKDFYDTAGIRTTAAFQHFRGRVPKEDAAAVRKLSEAGALIVGKTNMHALGMGTTGLQSCFGPVRNPWNADFVAGGSSSGSAAAVASGMCCATLDTDAIGSCRLPAACCGVVGFKGAYSLIDMRGILVGEKPPDPQILWLSHAGVMARNVEDVALVLDILAADGHACSFADSLNRETELRIGVADNFRADSEVNEIFQEAAWTIRSLGYPSRAAQAPLVDMSRGIGDIVADRRTVGDRHFKDIDLIVLPTLPTLTPRVEDAAENALAISAENTMFANYYGLPAISVPCGFDKRGLPVGLQIVGRPWGDGLVLRLARQYERMSGHNQKRPPI
jgi:aspartyl-tRNA(Asn)/glutamyl-tRNA(Gln) amidotransferase subunit A